MLTAKLWFVLDPACHCSAHDSDALYGNTEIYVLIDVICSILTAGFCTALLYFHVHVSSALVVSIDMCSMKLFSATDLGCAMSEWNLLQAILRRGAAVAEGPFCAQGFALLTLFVYAGLQVLQKRGSFHRLHGDGYCTALWYGWFVPPWILFLFVFFKAADVTELCSRVPSLINSWTFGEHKMQFNTQKAVQYIVQSEAGYYVNGVRITSHMTMKATYLLSVVVFTVASQLFKNED